jgi:DNA polymerase-3 subunit epsilon
MAWYSRFLPTQDSRQPALDAEQQQAIAAWGQLPPADCRRSHYRSRYVVVDVEAGGANGDGLQKLGAVAVVDGLIDFADAFYVDLSLAATGQGAVAPAQPTAQVLADRRLVNELISFLRFTGKAPLVAYHAAITAKVVKEALAEALGVEMRQPWIDLDWVIADLFRDVDRRSRLDEWLTHFEIESIERHHPVSDAYVTAKLLQITIARAARKGFDTPASLLEIEKARRHMHQSD